MTNRLALAPLNTVTEQLHSPGRGDRGMFAFLIALVAVENRLVFQASLEFLPALLSELAFCKWVSSSDVWASLVLDCGLCTWHSDGFLCVEVKACEGSSCPEESRGVHAFLV